MLDDVLIQPRRGVYDARRAAALAGIPRRTLYYWAETGLLQPSISPTPRDYLWSWSDLLALRAIDWLRQRKDDVSAPRVPAARIRQALIELERDGLPPHRLRDLFVSDDGSLFFAHDGETIMRADASRQMIIPGVLNLVSPYLDRGPDLLEPRPLLRIVPGKLSGQPHVVHTRISTSVLFASYAEGYTAEQIREMYPDVSSQALEEAIDFEESLMRAA